MKAFLVLNSISPRGPCAGPHGADAAALLTSGPWPAERNQARVPGEAGARGDRRTDLSLFTFSFPEGDQWLPPTSSPAPWPFHALPRLSRAENVPCVCRVCQQGRRSDYQCGVVHLSSRGKACVHTACVHMSSSHGFSRSGAGGPSRGPGKGRWGPGPADGDLTQLPGSGSGFLSAVCLMSSLSGRSVLVFPGSWAGEAGGVSCPLQNRCGLRQHYRSSRKQTCVSGGKAEARPWVRDRLPPSPLAW